MSQTPKKIQPAKQREGASQVVIENPIINSPFEEPKRHFRFSDDGITNEIVETRRASSYFVPIARPRRRGGQVQLSFDTNWTEDRIKENDFINRVRARVSAWRQSHYNNYREVTKTTKRLLEHWTSDKRESKLFFCQVEALETIIYVTEVAKKYGDVWIENELRRANETANPLLYRLALKMATGSGKTVVMAMLIAWHTLNKIANSQDTRFADAFLIITPGITIRDRLRVLLPNDPQSYYKQTERDIVPLDLLEELNQAKIIITNYHSFMLREYSNAARFTKRLLTKGEASPFTETPDQMVRRVCRELRGKKNIIVINDEAHHCYRRRPEGETEELKGIDLRDAERRDEEARIWISGIEAVKSKIGVKVVYDLSATPFFLRGSGYSEGTLFPWVTSDFSLIDAIESGIVKVPRVPVADDAGTGEQPTYRNLWHHIQDGLPKKGRKVNGNNGNNGLNDEPNLPAELQGALLSLYGNYEKYYRLWERSKFGHPTPPVMIVVCSNTNVSKLIYDYIAGWDKALPDGSTIPIPGKLSLFSNVQNNHFISRPNTILIDSEQLESGEAMSKEFKKIAALEIETFKDDYRTRFPGRDADKLTDEDLLREVMNTVGKPGKLGEGVKCVVSVSMLTEGWDANTVTHVLGVRAFGTQLLCEQVVGRALRRTSYVTNEQGFFEPEYAEVYGVPFSFIPSAGSARDPKPGPPVTRVRAFQEHLPFEITFPRVIGYRYEFSGEKVVDRFTKDSILVLSTQDIPTITENAPIIGEMSIHTLDGLRERREQEVAFELAKRVMEKYFKKNGKKVTKKHTTQDIDPELFTGVRPWLFPQILRITQKWLKECLVCKDNVFPQLLLLAELRDRAVEHIRRSIDDEKPDARTLFPILRPYDTIGSTRNVSFDTTKPVYRADPAKCPISYVVIDSGWESKMAQTLEEMKEVKAYVKNYNLGFTIPYIFGGEEKNYYPDFIVRIDDGHGNNDLLNLIVEVSGEERRDKKEKVATAQNLWVPAINNHGDFGRWSFIEINDPWNAKTAIRANTG